MTDIDMGIPVEITEQMAEESVGLEYFEAYTMPRTKLMQSYHHHTEENIPLPLFML